MEALPLGSTTHSDIARYISFAQFVDGVFAVHIFSFFLFHSHSIAIILLINSLMKFQFVYQDFL